jgi:hypothetical protein
VSVAAPARPVAASVPITPAEYAPRPGCACAVCKWVRRELPKSPIRPSDPAFRLLVRWAEEEYA